MRFWSIGFIVIALFALFVAFAENFAAMELARTLLGVGLGLFVLWLLWDRHHQHDRRQDE